MLKGRKAQMTEPALTATQMLDVPDDSAAAVKSELDPANSTDCCLETEQPVSSDFNQDGTWLYSVNVSLLYGIWCIELAK